VLVQIAPSDLAEQSEVVRRLQRLSPAPSVADLEDLAEGDEFPRLSQDPDTGLVHFSTVAARAVDDIPETSSAAVDDLPETSTAAGALLIRPVEFLVGPDWLVTSWPTGVDETPAASTTDWGQDELLQSVVIDWTRLGTPTPWTLSLLITRRLAREYEQVVRSMGSWLENWEYAFVKGLADTDAKPDTQTLREVRGSVARLRQSLIALQSVVRGIEDRDLGDASLVADTRGSVDAALALLTELNDSVRGCMQLVSMKIAQGTQLAMEQTHSSSESTRRVFEYVAAFLAGPALIVGIFGANTWVPASGTVGGFVWMLLLSAITGILAFLTVSTVSRRRRAAQSRPAVTDLPASDAHALEPRAAARTGSQFRTVTT
jgi:Mg2+ and Co2+ transporter CorA